MRLSIPELAVGVLVGKGGIAIKELMSLSGASIKVSQKGEVVPGTTNRIVTISGNPVAANYAHMVTLVSGVVFSVCQADFVLCFAACSTEGSECCPHFMINLIAGYYSTLRITGNLVQMVKVLCCMHRRWRWIRIPYE
jgi:hypothetical protein